MWWAAGRARREQRLVQSMLRRGWIPLVRERLVRVVGRGRLAGWSRGCRGRTQFLSCGVPGCSICTNLPVTRFLGGGVGGVVFSSPAHISQRHTVHSDALLGAQDLRTTTHLPKRRKKAEAAKERRHATARTCAATSYGTSIALGAVDAPSAFHGRSKCSDSSSSPCRHLRLWRSRCWAGSRPAGTRTGCWSRGGRHGEV